MQWDAGATGWVLLRCEGMRLVTSRVKLGPDSRRQYLSQWARRKANDKNEKAIVGSMHQGLRTTSLRYSFALPSPSSPALGFVSPRLPSREERAVALQPCSLERLSGCRVHGLSQPALDSS